MLHLTNTLGSCAAPCDPPQTYNQTYGNLYDLSWREGVSLHALLRANPEHVGNGAQDVLQPCWQQNDIKTDPYLGEHGAAACSLPDLPQGCPHWAWQGD